MSMIRTRWAAVGAAVAVTLGAGGLTFVDAAKSSGDRPVTVTIEPCRISDTRPDRGIGPRTTPLGAAEAYPIQGTGPSGNCNIPTDATGLVLNVTAVDATMATNLRLYPTGGTVPTASNLNPRPGAPPTPNGVTVGLNNDGKFTVRNAKGTVHIIIDVTAYLVHHRHDDRYYTEAEVDDAIELATGRVVGVVTTLAGSGTPGYTDSAGTNSRFDSPYGVAVDVDGTIYLADVSNHAIRRIAPSGRVTTVAGDGFPGWIDADGLTARFNQPYGVAIAPNGTIYVADAGNHRIRAITPAGQVTTLAGDGTPGWLDGNGTSARFSAPLGLTVATDGTIYVADSSNQRVRAITPGGRSPPSPVTAPTAGSTVRAAAPASLFRREWRLHPMARSTSPMRATTGSGRSPPQVRSPRSQAAAAADHRMAIAALPGSTGRPGSPSRTTGSSTSPTR